jgi:hypothetical protein
MIKAVQSTLFMILIGGASLLTIAWAQTPEAAKQPPRETKTGAAPAPDAPGPGTRPRFGRDRAGMPHRPGQPGSPTGFNFGGEGGEWGAAGGGNPFFVNRHPGHRFGGPLMSEDEIQEHQALEQAVGSLKSAKSDAEKTNATNEISKILEKWFKRDLERRERQIAEIETRVKKLQDQIEKRKKAKDEIISLQVKTIVNEAEGLGFPGHFDAESEMNRSPMLYRTPAAPPAAHFDQIPAEPMVPIYPTDSERP